MSPSQFHQFHARSFEALGSLSKLLCLIARAVLKWLPLMLIRLLELNFKENSTPQTSVKWGEKFDVSWKSFCRVQVHSTCRLLHFRLFIVYEGCQRLLPRREFPGLPGLSGFLQLSCSLLSLSLSDSSRNSLLSFFVMASENSEEYPCLLCLRFLFEVESPRDLCYLSVVRSQERKSKP